MKKLQLLTVAMLCSFAGISLMEAKSPMQSVGLPDANSTKVSVGRSISFIPAQDFGGSDYLGSYNAEKNTAVILKQGKKPLYFKDIQTFDFNISAVQDLVLIGSYTTPGFQGIQMCSACPDGTTRLYGVKK